MDFDSLSDVIFGDVDSLDNMLFVNFVQHQTFRNEFFGVGIAVPAHPLASLEVSNLDDWLQAHQVEHQAFSSLLGLVNPFNMLDSDWNKEEEFYDWMAQHLTVHEQIAARLGLT